MLIHFNIQFIIDAKILLTVNANVLPLLASLNNYAGGRYFICCASLCLFFIILIKSLL